MNPMALAGSPTLLRFAPDASAPIPAGIMAGRGTATRNAAISAVVIAAHAALLALLVAGSYRPPSDVVIPAMVVSESVEAPPPAPEPEAPKPEPAPKPLPRVAKREPIPPPPEPKPVTTNAPATEPAPAAPAVAQSAPAPAKASTIAAAPPTPPATKIELPSASAAYLDNPAPEYPRLSRRLNEQGTVVLRVLIGIDGTAAQAEVAKSSGFERLDHAALQAVRRWKYRPGTRNGVPEAMWFNVPVKFVLE
jgi:protein TonB